MEREELERYTVKKWVHSEWEIVPDENGEFFWVEDVNPVLEKIGARIKFLEGERERLIKENEWLHQADIDNLSDINNLKAKINELQEENEQLKSQVQKWISIQSS